MKLGLLPFLRAIAAELRAWRVRRRKEREDAFTVRMTRRIRDWKPR